MARQRRKRHPSIGDDLARWLGYSVLFGLVPIGLRFLYLRTQVPLATRVWSTLQATLASGDLFLLTCCIGGAALGERMGSTPIRPRAEIFLGLACQVSIVVSVFFYTLTFSKTLNSTGVVATLSCALFTLTVLISAGLTFIKLQERRRR